MSNNHGTDGTIAISEATLRDRIKQISGILPGMHCGGHGDCGYMDCNQCADAIAKGASVAVCPACRQEAIDEIAAVMGVDTIKVTRRIAFIKCSGKTERKRKPNLDISCAEAVREGFLPDECSFGCVGSGSCTKRCKFGAMTLDGCIVKIDKEKCAGCGACVTSCPQNLITTVPYAATNFIPCASKENEERTKQLCDAGCIGCSDCVEVCPVQAITIVDNHAVIDYTKCVGCTACTLACRKKIIVDLLHDIGKLKDKVAFVRCAGGYKAKLKYDEMGITNCKTAAEYVGDDICSVGCTGLGNCTKVCRHGALSIKGSAAYVDPDKCVGCMDCVEACPKMLISMIPYKGTKLVPCSSNESVEKKNAVCKASCIGCGDCVANCPSDAIHLENGHAVVDCVKCENCSSCTYVCFKGIIKEQAVPESIYLQMDALSASERKCSYEKA